MTDAARLTRATLGRVSPEHRHGPDPADVTIGVVHLGLGVFHRTHQCAFFEEAMVNSGQTALGVSAYSERSPDAAAVLARQDGLFSRRVVAADHDALTVSTCVREARFAPGDEVLLDRLADPAVGLVTLTVTEKGYRYDPVSGGLKTDDPELLADAAGRPPATVVGQLVRGLERRRRDGSPLTVVSCDNLPGNGALLARLVEGFAALPGARVDAGLADYLAGSVRFPDTVVDRISPAPGSEAREAARADLGLVDDAAVVTEPYASWVVEDRFAGPRPPLEAGGVTVVADVGPFADLKLRVLNGAHSAIAALGLLAGDDTVAESLGRRDVVALVNRLVDEEVAPTLTAPPGVDVGAYADRALERFANPRLAYANRQVASDAGNKLPGRLLSTVRACRAAGVVPEAALTVVAAYLRLVATGTLNDPSVAALRPAAGAEASATQVVDAALRVSAVFPPELADDAELRAALSAAYGALASAPRRGRE